MFVFAFAALISVSCPFDFIRYCKTIQRISAGLCIFLWLFVFSIKWSSLWWCIHLHSHLLAVLFWSNNINLLGVLITTKNKEADNARK